VSRFHGSSFFRLRVYVPAWLHALVEDPDYLDQARLKDSVE